jgi:hypothetical protein
MTSLAELVRRQTRSTLVGIFNRTAEKMAESMAEEPLQEPELLAQMQSLIRVAFAKALAELGEEMPPDDQFRPRRVS